MEKKRLSIKEWSEEERPREKFMVNGGTYLSNTELLAIIIGSGSTKNNAIEIARTILRRYNNSLREIFKAPYEEFKLMDGIGVSKAVTLSAVGELVKRTMIERPIERDQIVSSKIAAEIMQPLLKDLTHEECWVLYLNMGNKILAKQRISSGGINSTVLDVKMIIKSAMVKLSSNIILYHNHPSGIPKPGNKDIEQTRKLQQALKNCDITLLDHIIIAGDQYFSFADNGTI